MFQFPTALYSIRPCFYHQLHPQLGIVFALAPSLHSFWSYFSTDLSCNILGTYRPGEFLFQYPIILPFHTVLLKARILKWFAINFSSGPPSFRPLHHDLSVLGGPTQRGLVSFPPRGSQQIQHGRLPVCFQHQRYLPGQVRTS